MSSKSLHFFPIFGPLTHYNFKILVLTTFYFTSIINFKYILYFHAKELEKKRFMHLETTFSTGGAGIGHWYPIDEV